MVYEKTETIIYQDAPLISNQKNRRGENVMAGLPRKYAKMGFKRGWAAYKRARGTTRKRRTTRRKPVRTYARRRTYAPRKVVRRTRKNKLITKPFVDGLISSGGKVVLRKVMGGHPIYEAGLDIGLGYFRNNKTLLAQGMVAAAVAFLPNLGMLGGQGQEPWVGQ